MPCYGRFFTLYRWLNKLQLALPRSKAIWVDLIDKSFNFEGGGAIGLTPDKHINWEKFWVYLKRERSLWFRDFYIDPFDIIEFFALSMVFCADDQWSIYDEFKNGAYPILLL